MSETISISDTIQNIVTSVHQLKEKDLVNPVSIISPNTSMNHSINKALLKTGKPLLNVRVETFYQHILRTTEKALCCNGAFVLDSDQANLMISDILESMDLEYFKAADEFPSYAYYFFRVINELRVSIQPGIIEQGLVSLGEKGEELLQIYNEYLNGKQSLKDYSDLLSMYSGTEETLVLFPDIANEMSLFEKKALEKNKDIILTEYQAAKELPGIYLKNPLGKRFEIRDVFQNILENNLNFEDIVIIAPNDYHFAVCEEADRLNIPVFSSSGKDVYPDQIEVFKAVLNVMDSDFDYYELKKLFQLRGQFAIISALIDCGVATGFDLLKSTAKTEYEQSSKERLKKLNDILSNFANILSLKEEPFKLGKAIVEHFIYGKPKALFKTIIEDLERLDPKIDYDRWVLLILKRFSAMKEQPHKKQGSVLLTTESLPGVFEYVYFVGLHENSFPIRYREDPILLDHERKNINQLSGAGTLITSREKNIRTNDILPMTIACARKGWTGYFPSIDLVTGDELFASFHLIDIVKKMTGKDTLSREDYQDSLKQIQIPWVLNSAYTAMDYFDWSVCHLMNESDGFIKHILSNHESAKNHFVADRFIWSREPNEFTGFLNIDGRKGQSDQPYFSATELEKFMKCPYRWFVERHLKVWELEEPETLEKPDALIKGSILHDTIDAYTKKIGDGPHDRNQLNQTMNLVIQTYLDASGDIHPIYIDQLKTDLSDMFDSFLEHEKEYMKHGRKQIYSEFAFGTTHKKNDIETPAILDIGKRTFHFTGAIDRIDLNKDEAIILDYKGAAPKRYKEVKFNRGKNLQPALYAEAFLALKGKDFEPDGIHVRSGYLPLRGNYEEFVVDYDHLRQAQLEKIIDFIFKAMECGYFFTTGDCEWCDYGNICGKGIEVKSSIRMANASKTKQLGPMMNDYFEFEEF